MTGNIPSQASGGGGGSGNPQPLLHAQRLPGAESEMSVFSNQDGKGTDMRLPVINK